MRHDDEGATIILDLDDGVGEYSKMGVCSLDTSFRLLLLDKEHAGVSDLRVNTMSG